MRRPHIQTCIISILGQLPQSQLTWRLALLSSYIQYRQCIFIIKEDNQFPWNCARCGRSIVASKTERLRLPPHHAKVQEVQSRLYASVQGSYMDQEIICFCCFCSSIKLLFFYLFIVTLGGKHKRIYSMTNLLLDKAILDIFISL